VLAALGKGEMQPGAAAALARGGTGVWRRAAGASGAQLTGRAGISTSSTEKILKLDPLNPSLSSYRRTKIVCTIGPASWVRAELLLA
jgi:hypothetical protein